MLSLAMPLNSNLRALGYNIHQKIEEPDVCGVPLLAPIYVPWRNIKGKFGHECARYTQTSIHY
jgi:hypothetical protein